MFCVNLAKSKRLALGCAIRMPKPCYSGDWLGLRDGRYCYSTWIEGIAFVRIELMEQAFEKSTKEMRHKRVKCGGKYVGGCCGTPSRGFIPRMCVIKITNVLEFLVEFSKFLQCTQKPMRRNKLRTNSSINTRTFLIRSVLLSISFDLLSLSLPHCLRVSVLRVCLSMCLCLGYLYIDPFH